MLQCANCCCLTRPVLTGALKPSHIRGQFGCLHSELVNVCCINTACWNQHPLLHRCAQMCPQLLQGNGALWRASLAGDVSAVQAALASGADLGPGSQGGDTVLHAAAWPGHAGLVQQLIAAGADLAARNAEGFTALH